MHLDAITPKLLADTLRAAQQKFPLPLGWAAPHFLHPVETDSATGRDLALREPFFRPRRRHGPGIQPLDHAIGIVTGQEDPGGLGY